MTEVRVPGRPVSLVTGGNKGIGREAARRLVGAGHVVLLAARDVTRGTAAADTVGARFVQLDVTCDESVARAAELVGREYGHVDVLINNAGVTGPLRAIEDYMGEDMAEVVAVNVVGCVRVIHAFLPMLEKSVAPRIINVSSGLGSFGRAQDDARSESQAPTPLYAASKAAINMLTVRYAQRLPHMLINSVDPGMTATDLAGGRGQSIESGTDAIYASPCRPIRAPASSVIDRAHCPGEAGPTRTNPLR